MTELKKSAGRRRCWLLAAALLGLSLGSIPAAAGSGSGDVLEKHCALCHSTEVIRAHPRPAAEWDEIVRRMAAYEGSELSRVDQLLVRKYLREKLETKNKE